MSIIQPEDGGYVLVPIADPPGLSSWYTTDTPDARTRVRAAWKDAPIENLDVLAQLLDTAREQVLDYAPAPRIDPLTGFPIYPARYALAQLMQARNLFNAGRVTSDGDFGDGSYSFTPRPMDKTIRGIIRPEDGKPDVL
ncbi:hypothetical protein QE392_001391 [Microbacterium proteolyticum]|uniref:hypothetical protein n=1 Tax=Microbacterium proteolyticum TaxID=1572644 RepID=UPI0027829A28|nr:hypothetical protein [Microbacterium proteolyticum]MDQ1169587.1 hypothetical protein [Microbacterium proteolyticum]